jgi:hypothetical protein
MAAESNGSTARSNWLWWLPSYAIDIQTTENSADG